MALIKIVKDLAISSKEDQKSVCILNQKYLLKRKSIYVRKLVYEKHFRVTP